MITFATNLECKTKTELVSALQEIINKIDEDYSCGFSNYADGSWECIGTEEFDDEE